MADCAIWVHKELESFSETKLLECFFYFLPTVERFINSNAGRTEEYMQSISQYVHCYCFRLQECDFGLHFVGAKCCSLNTRYSTDRNRH